MAFSAIFGVALVICLLVLVVVWVAYWKLKKGEGLYSFTGLLMQIALNYYYYLFCVVMRNQAKPKMVILAGFFVCIIRSSLFLVGHS